MKRLISPTMETNLRSIFAFAGLLTLTGYMGSLVAGTMGLYLSLALSATCTFLVMYYVREIALFMMSAKEVKKNELVKDFDLNAMVETLMKEPAIGLTTKPLVCIVESDKINAFATGRSKHHTAVAITTGMLNAIKLAYPNDKEQANRIVEAIWCHELGHIVNHDIQTKGAISIISASLNTLCEYLYSQRRAKEKKNREEDKTHTARKTDGDDKQKESRKGSWKRSISEYVLFHFFIPFVGNLLSLCLSRARELAADDMAKQCGRGDDLAKAFEMMKNTISSQNSKPHTHAHLAGFDNMLCLSAHADKQEPPKQEGKLSWLYRQYCELTATHPPLDERIKRLRATA